MSPINKFKVLLLFLGDILALYAALLLTLIVRYYGDFYNRFVDSHFLPFTIIFALWLVIFYVAGLYDLRRLRNNLDFLKILGLTLFVDAVVAVLFFYLIPAFGITPKTNLFVFMAAFAVIELFWRRQFNRLASSGEAPNKVLLVGTNGAAETLYQSIKTNPQLGYEIKARLTEEEAYSVPREVGEEVLKNNLNLVVIPRHLKSNSKLVSVLYELLGRGVEIQDLINFYELILRKVPLADLEETWFLENLEHQRFYDQLKRALEFFLALAIGFVLLPLEILIALLVDLTSAGPIIYKQIRVGHHGKGITLYKFRTMKVDAEKDGPQWKTSGTRDPRLTAIGKILVKSHLDELPQIINILKGELSFVGPRPERPEFVAVLKEKIPYYEIRHLVKPGISGWAQINYRYGASVEDSSEKLEYDIYYIKNRSLVLDLAIILKTLKSFFINPQ